MLFETDGLVIRSVDYKDADKILTVLCADRGRMTVIVRGARSRNSPFLSASQVFSYASMVIFENRGRCSLNEAKVLSPFSGLSRSAVNMSLASYVVEVLQTEPEDSRIDPDILRLALNSLYALSEQLYPPEQVKTAFELRYMAMSGYEPDLDCCFECGGSLTETGSLFNSDTGELTCLRCYQGREESGLPLHPSALQAARYILRSDLKRLFSFTLSKDMLDELGAFTQNYLALKLERGFRALELYSSFLSLEKGEKI